MSTGPKAQDNPFPAKDAFIESACPFEAEPQVLEQVTCGYVTVPENRRSPGRHLRLSVAVIKSLSDDPQPDPLVMIQGGPGEKLIEYVPGVISSGALDSLRADREIVLFDQRGVGFSEPTFCPELNAEWTRLQITGLPPAERKESQREALSRCRATMVDQGVDLSQYNSQTNAADIEAVRQSLGYDKWNIAAVSYGTRAALTAIREYPEGIRAVVMDGPLPVSEPSWAYTSWSLSDVIGRLGARCEADQACASKFPDFEKRFWEGVENFERDPLAVSPSEGLSPVIINGNSYAGSIFQALYSGRSIPMVPLLVNGLGDRRSELVTDLATRMSRSSGSTGVGLKFAVMCFDDAPLNTPDARSRLQGPYPQITLTDAQTDPSLCDAVHPYRADDEQLQPVVSDIPTLLFTGEFDPTTHRSFGPMIARGFKNASVVEIPGAGHAESLQSKCGMTMVRDFLNSPQQKVDTECLGSLPELKFVLER